MGVCDHRVLFFRARHGGKVAKPFDATMRKLFELGPPAWLRFLHVSVSDPGRVRVIDSDLSTVTVEADKVLWVDEPEPWIEHIELQAGRDIGLPDRVHYYNTCLGRAQACRSIRQSFCSGRLPMGRMSQEATRGGIATETFTIGFGIEVEGFTKGAAMILGIRGIEESSVYQDIFAKGEAEGEAKGRMEGQMEGAVDEARNTLLRQAQKLGPLSGAVQARIAALRDLDRLNDLLDRILDVSTWDELLPPSAQPE